MAPRNDNHAVVVSVYAVEFIMLLDIYISLDYLPDATLSRDHRVAAARLSATLHLVPREQTFSSGRCPYIGCQPWQLLYNLPEPRCSRCASGFLFVFSILAHANLDHERWQVRQKEIYFVFVEVHARMSAYVLNSGLPDQRRRDRSADNPPAKTTKVRTFPWALLTAVFFSRAS